MGRCRESSQLFFEGAIPWFNGRTGKLFVQKGGQDRAQALGLRRLAPSFLGRDFISTIPYRLIYKMKITIQSCPEEATR